ncbi:MFS transporter [Opitutus terrae]|uniref:Major facilitator superfamily MFS_1 n=1 Tax=Opitutus terrae (strain DSM 11246 / JCM 15787 / PB90-1) TaxID=452637 RepID=B1ZP05_OPITP|nr:MFS transporter [Opitutus terrae]ACB77494.1 major facilitator superfamily MFS_1 [Opitutus terrae PB90-1]
MIAPPRHTTAPADRVPVQQKIAYGLGAIVTIVAVNSVVQLTSLVYVVGLGISAIWIGYAQAFPRLWDALVDPFLGNLSDNSRSRFGRRIPFLVVGGVLIGVAFWLLWTVPRDWSKPAMFTYFVVASLFFYTVVPIYAIPHGALGMEMTDDYHEKTSIFAYASFIGNVGAIALPWIYFLANRPVFGGDTVNGIKWVCMGMSVILTIAAMVCAFVCKERKFQQASTQQRVPIIESFKTTYRNGTFVRLVTAFVLLIVAFQLVMGFNNYITIFYLYGGNTDAASRLMAHNGTLWAAIGIAGVFPMTWIAKRFGKRHAVLFALALIIGGNLVKIVCYNRDYPYLTMIPTMCLSLGMVIAFSLVNAMIADICDEDELASGLRREGIYFAVYNWWWKVAVSIATVLSGYLQRLTGFVEGAPTQTEATLFSLRAWEIGLPPALCLLSVWLLLKYPLTEARAYEIKAILEQRKATDPAGA